MQVTTLPPLRPRTAERHGAGFEPLLRHPQIGSLISTFPNGHDRETGILVADYDDPTIPDETRRRTETFEINLSPGGTYTETSTLRDAGAVLQIRSTYHLTVVDGTPKVEHFAGFVRGCP